MKTIKSKFITGIFSYVLLNGLMLWLSPPAVAFMILQLASYLFFAAWLQLRLKRRPPYEQLVGRMKRGPWPKRLTWLLVSSLVAAPIRVQADDDKDNVIAACFIVALGAIVVSGLVYVCKKLPPPPGTCGCGCGVMKCSCNGSPEQSALLALTGPPVVTNAVSASPAAALPPLQYVAGVTLESGSLTDSTGNTWNYSDSWSMTLEASPDLQDWSRVVVIHGWTVATGGVLVNVVTNGVSAFNGFYSAPNNASNNIPVEFATGGSAREFFRMVCK